MATSTIRSALPRYTFHEATDATHTLTKGMYLYVFGYMANEHRNGVVLVTVRNSTETAQIITIGGDLTGVTITDDGQDGGGRKIKVLRTSTAGSVPHNVFYMGDTN